MPKFSWEALLGRLGKLGKRERFWALVWVVVVLGAAEFHWMIRPRIQGLQETSRRLQTLEEEKIVLLGQQPDIRGRQATLATLKGEIGALYERLMVAEKDLLDFQDVDRLLDSLVKDRQKFEMQLNAIRPIRQQEASSALAEGPGSREQPEPYKKLHVQLDIYSSFKGLLDYLEFLETMRPYQQVEAVQVKVEGKDASRPHAVLLLSVLMGDTVSEKQAQREEILALLEDVAARERKDPFLTGERPKEVVPAVGLALTGIFFEGSQPVAAMINDQVYTVGQVVQDKRIVAIGETQVFLEQGNRRFVLPLAQEGGT